MRDAMVALVVRTSLEEGELLRLKAIVLAASPVSDVSLHWRPMGSGRFTTVPLNHVARGVYRVDLATGGIEGIGLEYFIRVTTQGGQSVQFPATAPELNQTVVLMPKRMMNDERKKGH